MVKITVMDDDNDVYTYDDRIVGRKIKKDTIRQDMIQQFSNGKIPIIESTELGESLKHLNDVSLTEDKRFSGIDLRSRLHQLEISGLLAIDILVSFGYIPRGSAVITVCKKRLSVSKDGKGRQEIVDITTGKRDMDAKRGTMGFAEKAKNLIFPPRQEG